MVVLNGLLNGIPYDFLSMAAASSDTLKQLPGTKIDPNAIPALNNSMKKAANNVEATDTDKNINNEAFISAIVAAVAAALAEVQPDPAPEPTAAPDPEPSTAPDPGTDTNYSGILGLILSAIKAIASGIWDFFCDPMGAITTGLTNLYNGVLRIIEIFPEQVQLVLGNIASLPSAMLQVFADPWVRSSPCWVRCLLGRTYKLTWTRSCRPCLILYPFYNLPIPAVRIRW